MRPATNHRLVPTKLAFVIYRRDLASSAPTEVFVRVVAQVEREMKFNVAGPPTLEKIEGQWAIRSKSYEFNVAPIDDNLRWLFCIQRIRIWSCRQAATRWRSPKMDMISA